MRLTVIAAGLWLILTEGQGVGIEALVVVAAAVWVGQRYRSPTMRRWRPLPLARFLGYFLRGSLRGGLDVAQRAFQPSLPIRPLFVRRRLRLEPSQPRTLLVVTTSLMPGTLAAEIDGDELIVHVLAPGMEREVAALEACIAALFPPDESAD